MKHKTKADVKPLKDLTVSFWRLGRYSGNKNDISPNLPIHINMMQDVSKCSVPGSGVLSG